MAHRRANSGQTTRRQRKPRLPREVVEQKSAERVRLEREEQLRAEALGALWTSVERLVVLANSRGPDALAAVVEQFGIAVREDQDGDHAITATWVDALSKQFDLCNPAGIGTVRDHLLTSTGHLHPEDVAVIAGIALRGANGPVATSTDPTANAVRQARHKARRRHGEDARLLADALADPAVRRIIK